MFVYKKKIYKGTQNKLEVFPLFCECLAAFDAGHGR